MSVARGDNLLTEILAVHNRKTQENLQKNYIF